MADTMNLIRQDKIEQYFRSKRKLTVLKFVSHITQRAAEMEPLSVEDKDFLYMLSLLKDSPVQERHIKKCCKRALG